MCKYVWTNNNNSVNNKLLLVQNIYIYILILVHICVNNKLLWTNVPCHMDLTHWTNI